MSMTKKDYQIIAAAIYRTRMIQDLDKNAVRKQAKRDAIHLLVTDLTASLAHDNDMFDKDKFLTACGVK